MVKRLQPPGEIERAVVTARTGRDHADVRGCQGYGGEQDRGFQPPGRLMAHVPTQRRSVGQENRIERAAFGNAGDVLVIGGIEHGGWRCFPRRQAAEWPPWPGCSCRC
jgi:hypothetical protein